MGDRIQVQFNNDKLIKKTGYIDGYIFIPFKGIHALVISENLIVEVHIDAIIVY